MEHRTDSERIAIIETIVIDLKQQLLGNGQKGHIETLHLRISNVDKRVDILDNWRWLVTGAATVIGMMAGTVLGYTLR